VRERARVASSALLRRASLAKNAGHGQLRTARGRPPRRAAAPQWQRCRRLVQRRGAARRRRGRPRGWPAPWVGEQRLGGCALRHGGLRRWRRGAARERAAGVGWRVRRARRGAGAAAHSARAANPTSCAPRRSPASRAPWPPLRAVARAQATEMNLFERAVRVMKSYANAIVTSAEVRVRPQPPRATRARPQPQNAGRGCLKRRALTFLGPPLRALLLPRPVIGP
jgi:hypothetical protein